MKFNRNPKSALHRRDPRGAGRFGRRCPRSRRIPRDADPHKMDEDVDELVVTGTRARAHAGSRRWRRST